MLLNPKMSHQILIGSNDLVSINHLLVWFVQTNIYTHLIYLLKLLQDQMTLGSINALFKYFIYCN